MALPSPPQRSSTGAADPDETDDVGDLTETDFFERARWAATGESFEAPDDDEARAQALDALRAHLDEGAAQAARGELIEGFDVEDVIARRVPEAP